MAAQRTAAADDGAKDREREHHAALIARSVMRALGRPADFLRATVRAVNADTFRVNVVTGPDVTAGRIVHSYFVTADADGNLTASSPPITRAYPV